MFSSKSSAGIVLISQLKMILSQLVLCFLIYWVGCYDELMKVSLPRVFEIYKVTNVVVIMVCVCSILIIAVSNLMKNDRKVINLMAKVLYINTAMSIVLIGFLVAIISQMK